MKRKERNCARTCLSWAANGDIKIFQISSLDSDLLPVTQGNGIRGCFEFYEFSWHCRIVNKRRTPVPLHHPPRPIRRTEAGARRGILNLRQISVKYRNICRVANKMANILICKLNALVQFLFQQPRRSSLATRPNWMARGSWILMLLPICVGCHLGQETIIPSSFWHCTSVVYGDANVIHGTWKMLN